MTRGLLTGASRRSLLAGLIGGAAATIAGAELLEAKKKGKAKGRGKAKARSKARGKGNGNGNGGGGDDKQVEICHCPPGNPDNCHTIRVGKKAVASHLRNHPGDHEGVCDDDQDRCLEITELEAGAQRVGDDGLLLTTEGSDGFGAAAFGVPDDTTFSEIDSISGTFDFETGTCGAGTPRYCVVFTDSPDCACAQIPTELCDTETTGSFSDLTEPGVAWFRLCTPTGPDISTYEDALAEYGDNVIDYIFVVADESHGEQTVTLETCITLSDED